ncbi:uncharacterized protein LOC117329033 [Pecten maximus]|uniref:uncharacterized protein LOC117329033 n=1 Tax=Pecten maximus TaxID=6579 RepID=UPI0014582022|nr:uncharacterized protein LOC117329033 [Pecten maximus]
MDSEQQDAFLTYHIDRIVSMKPIRQENIHRIRNKMKPGTVVDLHGKKGVPLIYGTSPYYVRSFLKKRKTIGGQRGLLRDQRLHNISTEEGFLLNRHYQYWKYFTEDQFGRMTLCRGCDDHNAVTFLMLERKSKCFLDQELLFYLEFGGKVLIVPELLGVIEEDGYVKMMFLYTPGHDVLTSVVNAGRFMDNLKGMRIFMEQLVRGIETLHSKDVILGGIGGGMLLLDAELGSSTIQFFPSISVMTRTSIEKQHLRENFLTECRLEGIDPLTRFIWEGKARDMHSIGQLLQGIIAQIQNPPPLINHLVAHLLEPDKERRISASRLRKHPYFEQLRSLSMDLCDDNSVFGRTRGSEPA